MYSLGNERNPPSENDYLTDDTISDDMRASDTVLVPTHDYPQDV